MNAYRQSNYPSAASQGALFFYSHLVAACLLLTLFLPTTFAWWRSLDTWFFSHLNNSLMWGKGWQYFWAFASHRIHDWIEDGIFILFIVHYIKQKTYKTPRQKLYECLSIILFSGFIIYFLNKTLIRETLMFDWPSPTLVVQNCNRLSLLVPSLEIKDAAKKCFPGDHATTAILFAFLFAPLLDKKPRMLAIAYTIFLCLPRLIAGAHWLSDILIGSVCIGILAHAWYFFTPLHKGILRLGNLEKSAKS